MSRPARLVLWPVLAAPAAVMLYRLETGAELALDLLRPSGELAVTLMVAAMLPGPLVDAFGPRPALRTWLKVRRNLGVAAFSYALLHLALYVRDLGSLAAIVDELGLPGVWTGWAALALLGAPAAISSDQAMAWLGDRWKRIQRLVYPALGLVFIHWLLLDWGWGLAALHFVPLAAAWSLRVLRSRKPLSQRSPT